MRYQRLFAIAWTLALTGCDRGEKTPRSTGERPENAPIGALERCAKGVPATANPPATSSVVLGEKVFVVREEMPLRWVDARTEHLFELGADPRTPRALGHVDQLKGRVWDRDNWYTKRCFERCDGRTSMGVPEAVVAIDLHTGRETRLGRGSYGMGNPLPFGDHVYWGTYPHSIGGQIYRVPKTGGEQELVWEGDDYIRDLRPLPDGVLAIATETLLWIPAGTGQANVILKLEQDLGAVAFDAEAFFVAEYGNPYWAAGASGYIHRVPRAGGASTKLTGSLDRPSALTVHGDTIYFMLEESDAVWALPKTGGTPTVVVAESPQLKVDPCKETLGLWSNDSGLFFYRGDEFFTKGNELKFIPWAEVTATP